jgi:hypothetical protein
MDYMVELVGGDEVPAEEDESIRRTSLYDKSVTS